jgi:predicted lipid-binding transport protein (Tim44 family)
MKKIKKNLKILAIVASIICMSVFIWNYTDKSHADAGYHSSYSSGGSSSHSSSSSSSHSSSSHSSSSSSSHSSSNSSSSDTLGGVGSAVVIIIFIMIVILVTISEKINKKSVNSNNNIENRNDINIKNNNQAINEIKKYIPTFNASQFLSNGYNIFVRIEEAWMNFDLEKVRDCITDEMFNMYESQLTSMEMKGEQNIMKDFKLLNSAITDAKKQNNMLEVKTKYVIEFYDYIVNKDTQKVVRGNSNRKIKMVYEFTFIADVENAKLDKCPNCGAPLDINAAGICPYCQSKIVDDSKNWVMSKKVSLFQG